VSTNRILAIAALIAAVLSLFVSGPLLLIAVVLLALALLV
jgi:uncharacterized membrane protein